MYTLNYRVLYNPNQTLNFLFIFGNFCVTFSSLNSSLNEKLVDCSDHLPLIVLPIEIRTYAGRFYIIRKYLEGS